MKEKTRFKTSKLLLLLAIASLIVAALEGMLYYKDEDLFFRILLIIQNSINAFAFKSTISLKDALAFMHEDRTMLKTVVGYLYGIAVFTAPYCTIAFVYRLLERLLRLAFNLRRHKNAQHIVIFGYNRDVKNMIKNYVPDKSVKRCLHIVSNAEFSSEERFDLSKKGYRIHSIDILKADEADVPYLLKKSYVDRADDIIIFDDNSISNFSMLQMFSLKDGDGGFVLKSGAKVTCRCDDDSINELIADYYKVSKGEKYRFDLDIVSLPELQVRKMFSDAPLHTVYTDSDKKLCDWNVKMLILGFGSIGQQALLQAMDLSVVHSGNSVVIDVYDKDIESKMEIFTNRLSFETFETDGSSIKMRKSSADGSLTINCHKLNVRFREFIETVRKSSGEQPYTYALVAIDDINVGVNCAMRLRSIFDESGSPNSPIILRMDSDRRLAKYINNNDRTFSGVRLLEDRSTVLNIDLILNKEIDRIAKDFHYFYSGIQVVAANSEQAWDSEKCSIDELWRSISMFKRESSKALAAHESVKNAVIRQLAKELGISDVNAKIDSIIGENGSLMKYDGSIWRLNGDDSAFVDALMQDSFTREIAALEHRRWCYFVASLGWRNGKVRNDDKKIHTCLLPFDELTQDVKCRTTVKYDIMSLMARYLNERK